MNKYAHSTTLKNMHTPPPLKLLLYNLVIEMYFMYLLTPGFRITDNFEIKVSFSVSRRSGLSRFMRRMLFVFSGSYIF